MMPNAPVQVAVLARVAALGKGKTRLAATVGAEQALTIYQHLIRKTAGAVRGSALPATVFFDPAPGDESVWPAARFAHAAQQASSDLGERLRDVVQQVFASSSVSGVLLLGTDCPYLTGEVLAKAAALLKHHDAVLGPSTDGGYYLLGLRNPSLAVFDEVAWSTEAVADQTRQRFRENQLSWAELETLEDIDTEEDWLRYTKRFPHLQLG